MFSVYIQVIYYEYVDDIVFLTDMQSLLSSLANKSIKLDLKANISKTKIMKMNATSSSKFSVKGQEIEDITSCETLVVLSAHMAERNAT